MHRNIVIACLLGALPGCLNPDISDEYPLTMEAEALDIGDGDEADEEATDEEADDEALDDQLDDELDDEEPDGDSDRDAPDRAAPDEDSRTRPRRGFVRR